jgi:hypothetical protein
VGSGVLRDEWLEPSGKHRRHNRAQKDIISFVIRREHLRIAVQKAHEVGPMLGDSVVEAAHAVGESGRAGIK